MKKKNNLMILFGLICMLWFLSACSAADKDHGAPINTIEQLNSSEMTIGALEGSNPALRLPEFFPNAQYKYFRADTDGLLAVEQGQVDGFISGTPMLEYALARQDTSLKLITAYEDSESAFVISRSAQIPGLQGQINTFLAETKESGLLDEMYQRWFRDGDTRMPELTEIKDPVATLRVGVSGMMEPIEFYMNDEVVGFGAEFIKRFAHEMGYRIEFRMANLPGLLADCQTGNVDVICGSMSHTAEREKIVDFSDIVFATGASVAVIDPDKTGSKGSGFINYLTNSVVNTFIVENRWKMLLSGFKITVLISTLSIVLGSAAGFALCMAGRSRKRILSICARALIQLVQGMPIVLLLMICFYLIFARIGLGEITVAILTFSLYLSVYVADMLDAGISGVSRHEIEGAKALGFKKMQTLMKIVFPEAISQIFPVYQGHVVNLVKQTSIVGYIAVVDLTKASDLIRSRTFDAFFPLITTTILYFALTRIYILLLKRVQISFFSRRHRSLMYKAGAQKEQI